MSTTNEFIEMDSSGKLNKGVAVTPQDFIRGTGTFVFSNGDRYDGEYLATKAPLSIVREGVGTYRANDDSVYEGCWARDYLEKADPITFPDKSQLSATLENMMSEGPGTYKFKEVEIHGFLFNNQFVGDLILKDPAGHCWRSSNSKDAPELFFSPVQVFWQSVINAKNCLMPYEIDGAP